MRALADVQLLAVSLFLLQFCTAADHVRAGRRALHPPVGLGAGSISYYSPQWVFVDIFKQSMPWRSDPAGVPLDLDGAGWVRSLLEGQTAWTLMFRGVDGAYPGGDYICLYDGRGKLTFHDDACVVATEPGRLTVRVDPSDRGIRAVLESTYPKDPLRNVRLIMPGFEGTYAEQPFHPRYLELLRGAAVVGFAGLVHAPPGNEAQSHDRVSPIHQTQAGPGGMALEYAVKLCNELGTDGWFSVPYNATDSYVEEFARLVRDGLDPGLRAYVEYSHDVLMWTTAPSQHCIRMGTQMGLAPDSEPRLARDRYYAVRAAQVMQIWRDVFGGTDRLVRVLAKVGGEESFEHAAAYQHADAFATAYTPGASYGSPDVAEKTAVWTVEQLLDAFEQELEQGVPERQFGLLPAARELGLATVSFYTTPALFANPGIEDKDVFRTVVDLCAAAHRHPRMEQLYLQMIENWERAGGGLWLTPGLVSSSDKWGHWTPLDTMTQTTADAPKWAAVRRAIARVRTCTAAMPEARELPVLPEPEERSDPAFGRIGVHMEARFDLDGYLDAENPVAFDLLEKPAASVFWTPPFLNGQEKQKYYRVYITKNPERWQEYTLRIMPRADGNIAIRLQAASAQRYKKAAVDANYGNAATWTVANDYDDIRVQGASLENGDFERVEDGRPVGWQYGWAHERSVRPARLVNDVDDAPSGQRFLRASNRDTVIGLLSGVRAGRPVTISYRARAVSIEDDFNVRVVFDGLHEGNRVQMTPSYAPLHAVMWAVDAWRGEWPPYERGQRSRYRRALLSHVPNAWTDQKVVLMPDADGEVTLTIHGARIFNGREGTLRPRWVDYDDFRVEGAELANGSFEEGKGLPLGWDSVGRDVGQVLMQSDSCAARGRRFVRLWYERGLRTQLKGVLKGVPVTIRFRARAL